MPSKKQQKRKLNADDKQYREKILSGPDEADKKALKVIHEMNEQLKEINPTIALLYRLVAVLASNASELLHMEYVARHEDEEGNFTGEEKMSFMPDDEVAQLEAAIQAFSTVMLKVAQVLAERAEEDEKQQDDGLKGPRSSRLQA